MWRATLRNKKSVEEREKRLKKSIEKKNKEDPLKFTNKDILAMIIAAFQILLPILFVGIGLFALVTFLFTRFFLR
ncbi:hypothetical protein NSA23_04010 [Anaerosalibacter massiliensis]|uniref:Uncharacterized protein n=1 Tax=Anaerosalibacter massiliensis TaxID=1347392 RepID=A0A9X2S666_9FIRM|nr:hypothetical protein [Anaerosalibacter massiliensis]MCR2043277.1 hypothetical protein [Anaerosalibacter massiliensis]